MAEFWVSSEDLTAIMSAATNNDSLPASLESTVHRLIADTERTITLLDAEVDRIQPELDRLRNQRQSHVDLLRRYRTVVAPHRKLPIEMLQEIFINCSLDPVLIPIELDRAPWKLARVCSKWRHVALATPTLWSDIQVPHIYAMTSALKSARMMQRLFDYSGKSPISLDIVFHYSTHSESDRDSVSGLTELLVAAAARLEHLSFYSNHISIHRLFSLPPGSMEKLRSLKMVDVALRASASTLGTAPNLRQITFVDKFPSTIDNIPFPQLTHLTIVKTEMASGIAFLILTLCRDLVQCTLHFRNDNQLQTDLHSQDKPKILPRLEKLQLQVKNGSGVALLWISFLSLPSLVDFCFTNDRWSPHTKWHPAWTPVITHSGLLENLDLRLDISAAELEDVLGGAPKLLRLDISHKSIPQSALSRMSPGDLLPLLNSLRCSFALDATPDALFDMLESRKGIAPIAEVGIYLSSTAHLHLHRIQRLIEDGWKIDLLH
ncbi:hypothetical protein Hypma_002528 [Hypsizygus marmoreus]|uniref:F-box domain-containing protein n=1 Tax=Hypsizygus marmoreus TaxID=39966 RepID=A0A369J4B4_HYPMA|nr:hypothetical protein Hypma_002528 [Hypsizygus marmoreus]